MKDFGRLPYIMATYIYKEGIECDAAARNIRLLIPNFFENIKRLTKGDLGDNYKKEKERA